MAIFGKTYQKGGIFDDNQAPKNKNQKFSHFRPGFLKS